MLNPLAYNALWTGLLLLGGAGAALPPILIAANAAYISVPGGPILAAASIHHLKRRRRFAYRVSEPFPARLMPSELTQIRMSSTPSFQFRLFGEPLIPVGLFVGSGHDVLGHRCRLLPKVD
jgi:hypothetical protein